MCCLYKYPLLLSLASPLLSLFQECLSWEEVVLLFSCVVEL
jgi:hypothetical protein